MRLPRSVEKSFGFGAGPKAVPETTFAVIETQIRADPGAGGISGKKCFIF